MWSLIQDHRLSLQADMMFAGWYHSNDEGTMNYYYYLLKWVVKTKKDTNRMMTSYLEGVKVYQDEVNWEKPWTVMNQKSLEEKCQNQYGFL